MLKRHWSTDLLTRLSNQMEKNTLAKVVAGRITWYGFYDMQDKDKAGKRRVKLNAALCVTPSFSPKTEDGHLVLRPVVVQDVSSVREAKQEEYNALLIEASEWRGTLLFEDLM